MPKNNDVSEKKGRFLGKHRISSNRRETMDYSCNGKYFITICTHDRKHLFGEIIDAKMQYSPMGVIANIFLQRIQFKHNFIIMDKWIVMPNHIHMLLGITNWNRGPIYFTNDINPRRFGQLQKKSISSIVNHYKGKVKKWANKNLNSHFKWQKNYHDHVVRDGVAFHRIRKYIIENPQKWKNDTFN